MSQIKFPPLPRAAEIKGSLISRKWHDLFTEDQVKEYRQQVREAVLEEVADFIRNWVFLHDKSPAKLFANELVPKILELK